MLNNPLDLIYRNVYNKSMSETIYEGIDKEVFDPRVSTPEQYCINIIVPKGKEVEIPQYAQEQLKKLNLPYQARLEKRTSECYVFTVADASLLESHRSKVTDQTMSSSSQPNIIRATSYHKRNVPLDDLLNHFKQFGILKIPVVNETMIKGNFDLDFEFDAENPNSFKEVLTKLGLKAERKTRDVEFLVIYKN